MLSQQLIENALALCGKTMDYIIVEYNCGFGYDGPDIRKGLSIEKFFYSLLDRQFLIKYYQNQKPGYLPSTETTDLISGEFGYAIMEYQSGNETPLVELLTKIKG